MGRLRAARRGRPAGLRVRHPARGRRPARAAGPHPHPCSRRGRARRADPRHRGAGEPRRRRSRVTSPPTWRRSTGGSTRCCARRCCAGRSRPPTSTPRRASPSGTPSVRRRPRLRPPVAVPVAVAVAVGRRTRRPRGPRGGRRGLGRDLRRRRGRPAGDRGRPARPAVRRGDAAHRAVPGRAGDPVGGDTVARVVALTEAAIWLLEVVSARSTGRQRDRSDATLVVLRTLRADQLSGGARSESALGHPLPYPVESAADAARLARDVLTALRADLGAHLGAARRGARHPGLAAATRWVGTRRGRGAPVGCPARPLPGPGVSRDGSPCRPLGGAGRRYPADGGPSGADWVAGVPRLVEEALARWDLVVDGRAAHGVDRRRRPGHARRGAARPQGGVAAPRGRARGPGPADVGGRGAVRLVAALPSDGALLLERLDADDGPRRASGSTRRARSSGGCSRGCTSRLHRSCRGCPSTWRRTSSGWRRGRPFRDGSSRAPPGWRASCSPARARSCCSTPTCTSRTSCSGAGGWTAIDPKPRRGPPRRSTSSPSCTTGSTSSGPAPRSAGRCATASPSSPRPRASTSTRRSRGRCCGPGSR